MRLLFIMLFQMITGTASGIDFGKIEFKRSNYDFGTRHRGEIIIAVFDFVNTGKGELVIEGVHAECGCLSLNHIVGQVYFPGDRGKIEVKFDSGRFKGKINKKIVVATNSKGLSSHTLALTGNLVSAIDTDPPVLNFGPTHRDANKTLVTYVFAVNQHDFKILRSDYDEKHLRVETKKVGAFRYQLSVFFDAKKLAYGIYKSDIKLLTSHPKQKEISLLVRADVQSRLTLSEKYLEFGGIDGRKENIRTIQLTGVDNIDDLNVITKLVINDNDVPESDKLLSMTSTPVIGKKALNLTLVLKRLEKNWPDKWLGPLRGVVRLTTADMEEISLPIYGYYY